MSDTRRTEISGQESLKATEVCAHVAVKKVFHE